MKTTEQNLKRQYSISTLTNIRIRLAYNFFFVASGLPCLQQARLPAGMHFTLQRQVGRPACRECTRLAHCGQAGLQRVYLINRLRAGPPVCHDALHTSMASGQGRLPAGMHSTLQWPVGRQACRELN